MKLSKYLFKGKIRYNEKLDLLATENYFGTLTVSDGVSIEYYKPSMWDRGDWVFICDL